MKQISFFLGLWWLGWAGNPAAAQSGNEMVTVHLKNGQVRSGILVQVGRGNLRLQPADAPAGVAVGVSYQDVRRIDFPPPPAWDEAMKAFYQGDYATAAKALEGLARQRTARVTYYPAPGNYASLADRRLLDCYQRLVEPEKLGPVLKRIEWEHLSEEDQAARATAEVWGAAGNGDWSRVIEWARKLEGKLDPGDARVGELSYLQGMAHEKQNDPGSALVAYGGVIGLFPGSNRRMASLALQHSAQLLLPISARRRELKALLQIYQQSYGNGKLWEGAPAELVEILAQ